MIEQVSNTIAALEILGVNNRISKLEKRTASSEIRTVQTGGSGTSTGQEVVLVSSTTTVTTTFDLEGKIYRATGGFSGNMFEVTGSGRLTCSQGTGIIDGSDTARGFNLVAATSAAALGATDASVSNIHFQNTIGDYFFGGDRPSQTGGANTLFNCIFTRCGPLQVGGMNPSWESLRFYESKTSAIHIGLLALPHHAPNTNWVSNLRANNLYFESCSYDNIDMPGADNGVVYAGRNITGSGYFTNLTFVRNATNSIYIDDMASDFIFDYVTFINNLGPDFKIGGGRRNQLTNAKTIGGALASTWDDRGNAALNWDSAGGGGMGGNWHDYFHATDEGVGGVGWTHAGKSGNATGLSAVKFLKDYNDIIAPASAAWLASKPNITADFITNEATWATSGTLGYDRVGIGTGTGVTPAPTVAAAVTIVTVVSPAPSDATYVTMSADSSLPNERVLVVGTSLSLTDGGASSAVTLNTIQAITTASSPVFTGISLKAGTAAGNTVKVGGALFDHYVNVGNVGTGEDDLYSDTLLANTFATNGDKILARYAGVFTGSATANQIIKCYFGGTTIYSSGTLAITSFTDWDISIMIIRESSSAVRCTARAVFGSTPAAHAVYTRVTSLTLSNSQILKITGEASGVGPVNDDIIAKSGYVQWLPAA